MEHILTGESVPAEKKTSVISTAGASLGDLLNMAFMSTSVVRGRGCGVVVATGKTTEIGKISKALSKPNERYVFWHGKLQIC